MASLQVSSNLIVQDCTADTAAQKNILSYKSEAGTEPLTMQIKKFDRKAPIYPGYDWAVGACINNLQFFFSANFLQLCIKCIAPVVEQLNEQKQHELVRGGKPELERRSGTTSGETAIALASNPPLLQLEIRNLHLDWCNAEEDLINTHLSSVTISNGNVVAAARQKDTIDPTPAQITHQTKEELQMIAINLADLVWSIF